MLHAGLTGQAQTNDPTESTKFQRISLEECIRLALLQNRLLQIERLNPVVTESGLRGAYGYYDPLFTTGARWEQSTDPGGFDPTDFNRDTIYSADSQIVQGGLTGVLPGGLNYAFGGGYAHSEREFCDITTMVPRAQALARTILALD